MHTLSRASLTQCIARYAALGWSGYVPDACRQGTLLIPINIAKWMWGWPNRFLDRMQAVDTQIHLLGPYSGGGFSEGLDDPQLIDQLPDGYSGGISTDAPDLVMTWLHAAHGGVGRNASNGRIRAGCDIWQIRLRPRPPVLSSAISHRR